MECQKEENLKNCPCTYPNCLEVELPNIKTKKSKN